MSQPALLQTVYHRTTDPDRDRAFYEMVLGLSVKFDDPGRWTQFHGAGAGFALASPQESVLEATGAVAVFEVVAINDLTAQLVDWGCAILADRDMGTHGRTLAFRDPGGTVLQLFQRATTKEGQP